MHLNVLPTLLVRAGNMSAFMLTKTSFETVSLFFRLLGTDGRNINDIYRFTGQHSKMDIVKLSLQTGHIAPTAPDTLGENCLNFCFTNKSVSQLYRVTK